MRASGLKSATGPNRKIPFDQPSGEPESTMPWAYSNRGTRIRSALQLVKVG